MLYLMKASDAHVMSCGWTTSEQRVTIVEDNKGGFRTDLCCIRGKYLPKTAQSGEQGLPVELTVQRPDDWTKRRSTLHGKREPEVFLLSAPSTHVQPAGKTVVPGSDSSVTSALIAFSALRTKLKSWSSSITKDEHHHHV